MPLRLLLTCAACPEQYDVFDGDRQVGYIRLRHGSLTVECPDVWGTTVYSARTQGDGLFEDDAERDYHLRFAVAAILHWIEYGNNGPAPPPDVEYVIEETL